MKKFTFSPKLRIFFSFYLSRFMVLAIAYQQLISFEFPSFDASLRKMHKIRKKFEALCFWSSIVNELKFGVQVVINKLHLCAEFHLSSSNRFLRKSKSKKYFPLILSLYVYRKVSSRGESFIARLTMCAHQEHFIYY